jgi:hypothetical protein
MKHRTKLSQNQEHTAEHQAQHDAVREFASSDELLRFDAAQTTVPGGIAKRLRESSAGIRPAAPRPWWKSLFGSK